MAARPEKSTTVAHGVGLLLSLLLAGCGNSRPPTPSPPGTGTGEAITGRERIGWDQPASSATELAGFRYAIYVDGVRSEVADATCAATSTSAGFACSGRLPPMSNGAHTLELASFYDADGVVESARSSALRVTVSAATAPAAAASLQPGEIVTTADGVHLAAELLVTGLEDVADIAVADDGRILVAERTGRLRLASGASLIETIGSRDGLRSPAGPVDGGIASLALAPDFHRSGHLFAVHAVRGVFRVVRYRLVDGRVIERMPLLRDVPAGADGNAALRFGPDGKLYAALDDGGNRGAASKLSEWSGKILRLNPDGSTPEDQPAASPVFWSGLHSPRGLGWTSPSAALWVIERAADGVERIRALAAESPRPLRAAQAASYALPNPLGAGPLMLHRGEGIAEFKDNMFIAAREGGYLLRVRFDAMEPLRAVSSEKLLDGKIGQVRAVATASDGAVYIASDSAVWRLGPARVTAR